jgi:carboxynorspermidine decarboxylase
VTDDLDQYFAAVETPAFVVDERRIADNLRVLAAIKAETGCRILMALKAFAMRSTFDEIAATLDGCCATTPHEAHHGRLHLAGEVHAGAAAFSDDDMEQLIEDCDHIVFNSFSLWQRHRDRIADAPRRISCGIRVNPGKSVGKTPIYDPSRPGSRLGVLRSNFRADLLDGIEGLHFHALCEQDAADLEQVLLAFETHFGEYLHRMRWVNFGGGHYITHPDYQRDRLCDLINGFSARHPHLTIYLEPGAAVVLDAGFLVSTVLDIIPGDSTPIAILDTSATCHMPDVLEMPYRPDIIGAADPGALGHDYELGGLTCLAGDVIGRYAFDSALQPGQRLVFTDMAQYSMVKTSTFNGVRLPSIYRVNTAGNLHLERSFGYEDFAGRLG